MARYGFLVGLLCLSACATKNWHTDLASWYGKKFAGRPTASGEIFRPARHTAAHKTLPFGTVLVVRHQKRHVRVVINDRGPFVEGRALDLSRSAARRLGMIEEGVAEVQWRTLTCRTSRGQGPRGCAKTR